MLTRDKNGARNDRRRPWRTLRDDDATDAQKLQWRRDPRQLSSRSCYAVLEVVEIIHACFVHLVLQYSPHTLVNWI